MCDIICILTKQFENQKHKSTANHKHEHEH